MKQYWKANLIRSLVPLYPQRLSTCWKRLMLHSFPRKQQRGRSMNSTRGLGLTVKWRNRLTTSRSVRMPDCAGPGEGSRNSDHFGAGKINLALPCYGTSRSQHTSNRHLQRCIIPFTCSKLFNCHQRKADQRECLAKSLPFVLRNHLQLLPLALGLRPPNNCIEEPHFPDAESVPL